MRRGGGSALPDDGHRIFINCHSEERSDVGIRFLLCGSAARGEYGLPRAFHALAMTGFGGAGRSRRRGEGTPPYGGTYKVCVGAAALLCPTMDTAFSKNVIPRSEATWESVFFYAGVRRVESTDCHGHFMPSQ